MGSAVDMLNWQKENTVNVAAVARLKPEQLEGKIVIGELHNLSLIHIFAMDEGAVLRIIERSDVLLVSPGRRREVERLCPEGKEVIEFVYRPDQASVNLLKTALLEFRSQQAKEEGV